MVLCACEQASTLDSLPDASIDYYCPWLKKEGQRIFTTATPLIAGDKVEIAKLAINRPMQVHTRQK